LRGTAPRTPVVLTGDIHSFWVNDLENAAGKPVAVELVASSIATSTYDKSNSLPLNPGARFHRRPAQRLRALRAHARDAPCRYRDDREPPGSAERRRRCGVVRSPIWRAACATSWRRLAARAGGAVDTSDLVRCRTDRNRGNGFRGSLVHRPEAAIQRATAELWLRGPLVRAYVARVLSP
jgi:hypothetical protein